MAHYNVLFIGTNENLNKIYSDCPLSLDINRTEYLFDYDYLAELTKKELLDEGDINYSLEHKSEFTKKDIGLYRQIVIGKNYHECYDIRDNTSNHRITEERTEKELDKFFENLPENTHFFVCDGHL